MSDERLDRVRQLGADIADLCAQINAKSAERRRLLHDLNAAGYSQRRLGKLCGISPGRLWQIFSKPDQGDS